jgi:hypothetical protein
VRPLAERAGRDLVLLFQIGAGVDQRCGTRTRCGVVEEDELAVRDDVRPCAERAGRELVLLFQIGPACGRAG